jgi:hypothetical protein
MNATLDYSHRDILAARTLHNEIRNLVKAHERGDGNEASLQDIKVLCSCIIQTIRDPYCQERLCEVEIHSDELFAVDNRTRWGRSSSTQPNSMFLRRLIFKSLEAFEDRLAYLETERESARASGTHAEIRASL